MEHLLVAGIATVAAVVRTLPLAWTRCAARLTGRLILLLGGTAFAHVGRNLQIAFGPGLDPARRRALAKGFWIHLCQGIVEALHLARWTSQNCERWVDLSALVPYEPLRRSGRGVLVVSGHLGSWEVAPYACALQGYPVHLLHNPGTSEPVFQYLRRQRERSGMTVLSRQLHPWRLKKLLDKGAWLVIAADLNAGRRGTYLPFFGVLASSYLSPAALQQATRCPILVITTVREADGRHRLQVWREIPYQAGQDHETSLRQTMLAIHQTLEEAIRAHPEQWLWNYRRWRSRPPGETPGPDGLPPRCP